MGCAGYGNLKIESRFSIEDLSLVLTAGLACSALLSFGSLETVNADEEDEQLLAVAILSPVKPDRCADGVCTIEFTGQPEFDYTIYVSGDLVTWEPIGFFVETSPGQFEYADPAAADEALRYYQIEVTEPPISLPPQYEQLRQELGDEAFGEWLENNLQQFGNHQEISQEQVDNWELDDPETFEEFERIEGILEGFLADLENGPGGPEPEIVLPVFDGAFQAMGMDEFIEMLLGNQNQWGNYQGVCEPAIFEMENLYPELHQQFLDIELFFQDALVEGPLAPGAPAELPQNSRTSACNWAMRVSPIGCCPTNMGQPSRHRRIGGPGDAEQFSRGLRTVFGDRAGSRAMARKQAVGLIAGSSLLMISRTGESRWG